MKEKELLEWVRNNWEVALGLRGTDRSRRFGLGLSLAYTWNHTSDPRVALANLRQVIVEGDDPRRGRIARELRRSGQGEAAGGIVDQLLLVAAAVLHARETVQASRERSPESTAPPLPDEPGE